MIEVRGLTKTYAVGNVLDDLTFDIPAGEVCGLIGPNGAGKTTLLRLLATTLRPTRGRVRVAGIDLRDDVMEVRRRIGYMPDTFSTYESMRVDSFLEFFAHVYQVPRESFDKTIADVLTLLDLGPLRRAQISRLSLGVRQRLAVARVLIHNPEVLLLDEPVSGLDPRARVEMRSLLRELGAMGKTILISSHVLHDLADVCDRILLLERGRMIFLGTQDELLASVQRRPCVEIEVEGDPALAVELLKRQRWAQEVRPRSSGSIVVELTRNSRIPLSDISGLLFDSGFRITRFAQQQVDLEAAFLHVTGGDVS